MGASDTHEENDLVGADVLLVVVWGLDHRGHCVITDIFFTSVALQTAFLDRKFYSIGMVKEGSKGFPSSLVGFPKQHQLPHGTLVVKMHRSWRIVAVVWMDSKPV
jgi:hypothetical protein